MIEKREKWLKVLGKGMLTLPKRWRNEAGLETGDVVKAKKEGSKVVIELKERSKQVPYRIYTDAELKQFLEEDRLPKDLAKKIDNIQSNVKDR